MLSIAIFGGTFDPVHNGHLKTSEAIQQYFHFDRYAFLPCKTPVIKPPTGASAEQRVAMLRAAIKDRPDFSIDLREIERATPSYMVDTLVSFRSDNKKASITLIIGYDAFLSLPQWYEWDKIINLANLVVINRNKYRKHPIPGPIEQLLIKHQTANKDELLKTQAGLIYLFDAGDYEVSSTGIRDALENGKSVDDMLPEAVIEYIREWKLY